MSSINQKTISDTTHMVSQNTHQDELDLSKVTDLDIFLESAEDLYADAVRFQGAAKTEGYKSLSFEDINGEEIFSTLFDILKELQQRIVEYKESLESGAGITLKDADVTLLQEQYDDMILLRDLVVDTYQGSELSKKVSPATPVLTQGQSTKTIHSTQNNKIASPAVQEGVFKEIENELKSAHQKFDVIRARVLNMIPPSARTPKITAKLSEFNIFSNRLKNLSDRVQVAKKEGVELPVLRQTFGNYSRIINDITLGFVTLEQELLEQQSNLTLATKTIGMNKTSRVTPVEVNELKPDAQNSTSPTMPSEVEVTQLVRRVIEDQFYTESERQKIIELSESFHRAVACGEQASAVMQKYETLCDYVSMLERTPEVIQLRDRASRIIKRVTTGLTIDDEMLRRVRQLEHQFRQLETDPEQSDERIRNAYFALVGYVKDHERKWLTVCGMHAPEAGQKGIAGARLLRETLLIERDRHGTLIRDPKKQVLVDKLIRKLSSISPNGLSEIADIPEIIRLMGAIDVAERQGELNSVVDHFASVSHDENDVERNLSLGSQNPRHKVVDIVTDDMELAVEIRVANNTKELIAKRMEEKNAKALSKSKRPPLQPVVSGPRGESKKTESAVIAQIEAKDPINKVVSVPASSITRVSPVLEKRSLTKLYLTDPVYRDFISRHYTSATAFERLLDMTITQIEKKTIDVFERWLQEEYSSPFVFLEDSTVGEVLEFGVSKDVREILSSENIKYETFLAWYDLIDEMQSIVSDDSNMKFGELYARWMIETEMMRYEE